MANKVFGNRTMQIILYNLQQQEGDYQVPWEDEQVSFKAESGEEKD